MPTKIWRENENSLITPSVKRKWKVKVKRKWELTDHPLRALPHPDDVLRDRQVVRSTYPLNGVQETENLKIIPTSQYLTATLTWRVIKNYLYEKMNTHYLAETLIGWVVENFSWVCSVKHLSDKCVLKLIVPEDENSLFSGDIDGMSGRKLCTSSVCFLYTLLLLPQMPDVSHDDDDGDVDAWQKSRTMFTLWQKVF